MAVDVEEAGCDEAAARVDHTRGVCAGQIAEGGYAPVLHGEVTAEGGTAGSVDQSAAGD